MLRLLAPNEQCAVSRQKTPEIAIGRSGPAAGGFVDTELYAVSFVGKIFNRDAFPLEWSKQDDAWIVSQLVAQRGFRAAVAALNGDFAIVCLDAKDGTLWLARDRVGVRPLYFARTDMGFAAASRLHDLLALDGVSKKANRGFVARFAGLHYRTFDNFPEESPFSDIAQLPAAHVAEVRNGRLVALHRYWDLKQVQMRQGTEEDLAAEYRALLIDSVSCRVRRAGNPSFTLSGGMDSSSVLASAVHGFGRKFVAYSTVYSDPTYDETAEIRSMLASSVEDWRPVKIDDPDVLGTVDKMVRVHGEPVATATWLSHYLLCERAAADGFTSLFGGLGGDELNAGEYEYFMLFFADLSVAGDKPRLDREIDAWVEHHNHPVFVKSRAIAEQRLKDLIDPRRPGLCLPDMDRLRRYRQTVEPAFHDVERFLPVMEAPFSSYLLNRTYQDLTRETTPCCLRAEDRHSSHFGMENVDPFLDHRLVEFMFSVPASLKIRDGVTKFLLRRAMHGILPEDTRTRVKKTGWNAPAHVWFSGPELGGVRDLVQSRRFRERGVYNLREVERVLAEHEKIVREGSVAENHMMFIWQLVNLETWLSEFKVEL